MIALKTLSQKIYFHIEFSKKNFQNSRGYRTLTFRPFYI